MITSTVANKYVALRSFGSSSIVCCSEKSSVITKSFKSYSDLVSSSLEVKVLKKFLLMNQKSPQTYSLQVGVIIISYSEKSAKILKNFHSDSNSSPGFLDEGKE